MFGQLSQTRWRRRPPRFKLEDTIGNISTRFSLECGNYLFLLLCWILKHVMVRNVLVKWSLITSIILFLNVSTALAHPYLIFSNKQDIRIYEVPNDSDYDLSRAKPRTTIAVKGLEDAAALDFFKPNRVCWTEISLSEIRCSTLDPKKNGHVQKKTVIGTGLLKPEGLACDWVNNKIYWTDSETKRIEVASVDPHESKNRRVLVWENLDQPRSIAVSPNDGLMFWTDWGEFPRIERIGMNGDPETRMILKENEGIRGHEDIAWPNGLTLDYDKRLLYWVEAKGGMQKIGVMDWEGRNQNVILREEDQLPQPYAISVYDSELYWTDWTTNSIHIYNFSQGIPTMDYDEELYEQIPEKVKFRGRLTPMDIKVFDPARQKDPPQTSPCLVNNAGCSHLCLAAPIPQRYVCSCPTGIKLINNRTCGNGYDEILLLSKRDDLRRISLDTPDFSDIVIPIMSYHRPNQKYLLEDDYDDDIDEIMDDRFVENGEWDFSTVAIDYDPIDGKVYWTDQVRGIFNVFMNGTGLQEVITSQVDHPDGLAVDWLGRNLYWTDTGTDRIEVAKLDGTSRKVLISRYLDEPRDITLDPIHGWMYWSDWGVKANIERAWMDGSHRSVLVDTEIGWPNGIALDVDEQTLYWCDAKTDRIESINVDGTNRKIIMDQILPHPFGLTILGDYLYWTDWQEHTVERARKISGEDRRVLISHLEGLMSLQAVATRPDQTWYNRCKDSNGGCSHLCLMTPRGRVCGCPDGQELKTSGGTECIVPEAFMMYASSNAIGRISVQSPESNDHILPVHNLARVSSLDFDMSDGGIMYWSDLNDKKKSPKSISRAFLNGTNVEVIIEFGLESPDSIAVDWVANNIYWSDSILKRIQVSKSDGTSKRVILWKNLGIPTTIVLDPASGHIYWSTSGESAVIERANLDGTSRKIIVSSENIGRPSALAIDYDLKRLYWTDTEKQAISYVSLSKVQKQEIKTILHTASSQLKSLTLYNDNVYWTELDNKLIKRGNKYGGQIRGQVGGQITFQDKSTEVIDLFVYHKSRQKGTNNCAVNNGGCSELCLYVGNGVHKCACPSHHFLSEDNERCIEPEEFLLFGQKNKISRLLLDEAHPDEVHDLVLPVRGARDIRSLDYDPQSRLIYWIDHGSKKKSEHPPRVSIKRAFDNGTLHPEKRLHYSREIRSLIPYDLKVDWNSRLLFWTCERTNSINVTRLDYLEDSDYDEELEEEEDEMNNRIDNPAYIVGSILTGGEDKPRSITVHPYKSMVFWVNLATPVRIESARMDGSNRKTIVNQLKTPSDLTVDTTQDLLFWSDLDLKLIESSDLNGNKRKTLVSEQDVIGPVAIAVLGQYLYWADRSQQTISRVDKLTGKDLTIILSDIHHLASLTAVIKPMHLGENPCIEKVCSHICLLENDGKSARCSCPHGSGLEISGGTRCTKPPKCKDAEFTCEVGEPRCIPLQWRCDGSVECADHRDEMDCPECGVGKFRCRTGQCIDGNQVCDGVTQCSDKTDEQKCCSADQFMCYAGSEGKPECFDKAKQCDGTNDCLDASDELEPACNSINGPMTELDDESNTTTSILIAVVTGCFFVVAILIAVGCCMRRKGNQYKNTNPKYDPEDDRIRHPLNHPTATSSNKFLENNMLSCNANGERGLAVGAESDKQIHQPRISPTNHPLYPSQSVDVHNVMADSNSNNLETVPVSSNGVILGGPPSSHAGVASGIGCGSSNGLMYDRSHVTGASSSTTSSSGNYAQNIMFGGPPPSPVTSVDQRTRMSSTNYPSTSTHQRQHRSTHSLNKTGRHHNRGERGPPSAYRHYNSKNQAPPGTPCSTDVAEESGSDVYGAYGVPQQPCIGYDSEQYEGVAGGGSSIGARLSSNNPRRAPPSTPYISDCEGQEEESGSEILECPSSQQIFDDNINTEIPLQSSAPPPSPEPSSTHPSFTSREHEF